MAPVIFTDKTAQRTDHEILNRVLFTDTQRRRVESERPDAGVPEKTASGWELAAYRMPNGSRFVTLLNGSEAVWEAYCAEIRFRNGCAMPGDAAKALGSELTLAEKKVVGYFE